MKDPRATLYAALEANPENAELLTDTKAYFGHVIGQSATAKTQANEAIALAQSKFDTDLAAAQAVPAPAGDMVSRSEFDAMKKDYGDSQKIVADQKAEKQSTSLTAALNGKFNNIDEVLRNALVTSVKSNEGFAMGGKNYKASYDGESILMSVDGESMSLDSGVTSIMEAGLSSKVVGLDGGGMPAFDANRQQNVALGFDADINADLKS